MASNGQTVQTDLAIRRRAEILACAKHIFARKGFQGAKTEDIALALNVGKGTLYRYFKDKKTLFLAVFADGVGRLHDSFRQKVEVIADPPARIAAAARTYFEFFDADPELVEIVMQVRSEFPAEYRTVFMETYNEYIPKIQETLREGIRTGQFRQLDVERTAEAISGVLQGLLQSVYTRQFPQITGEAVENRPARLLSERAEAVVGLLLEGLLKRGGNDGGSIK